MSQVELELKPVSLTRVSCAEVFERELQLHLNAKTSRLHLGTIDPLRLQLVTWGMMAVLRL